MRILKKKFKELNIFILMLSIVIINIIAVFWFNNMVFDELESSAKSTLKQMANEQNRAVSIIIEHKRDNVIGIVDVVRFIGNEPEILFESMDIWENEYDIETLILTDLEGLGIVSTRETVDISDSPYLAPAISGEIVLSSVYESSYTGNSVLSLFAPIYYEGSIQGVIVAEYNVHELANLLLRTTDERGSSMIVNSEGEILVHTYPFPITFENFKTAGFEDGKTYEDILNDFATRTPGDVVFSIAGEKKLGEYIPLGVGDWTLFFEISEVALSDSGNAISSAMLTISASLLLAFFILIFYILWVRRKSMKQIEQVAYYDELTGVSNLVKFKSDLEIILNRKNFDSSKHILLKGDVENFKVINEVFGIKVGDNIIKEIATISKNMKGEIFEIARTGADEFIILAEKDKVENFFKNKTQYVNSLKQSIPEIKKHLFRFRFGRYFLEPNESNVDDMINKVSIAHSYARAGTGLSLWDYDDKFKNHILRTTELANKMEDALKNREFKMFLQPKYNLETNKIVGAEALVRWIQDDGTMVFPNEFIPLFEKNGFILTLDDYIFKSACELISKNLKNGEPCVPISVNFSRRHIENKNFTKNLVEIAKSYNVPLSYLEIELTETSIIENFEILNEFIRELQSVGFTVAIDDFGSGYSALGMLKEYKFDVVKLDRSFFVCAEEHREVAKTVLVGIINLVSSLGSKIVAEGIEYQDQVDFLRTVNCHFVQGYYFAKPMSSDDFEKLLKSTNID